MYGGCGKRSQRSLDLGVDISEMNEADILDADEVFAIGDGRFLIVEA